MESGGAAFGAGGLLLKTNPPPCFLSYYRKKPPPLWNFKATRCYCRRFRTLRRSYIVSAGKGRRASNSETVGSQRFNFRFRDRDRNGSTDDDVGEDRGGGYKWKRKKRKWWSDEPPKMAENEEEPGILEEAIDSLWILKVFKSYGWILPPILLAILLATGPKAFLVALALPIGQSLLTFVFQKLWERRKRKPKQKARKRRRPSPNTINDTNTDDEERDEEGQMQEKMDYQSWSVHDNGSVNQDAKGVLDFGGWDELDRVASMRRPPQMAARSHRKTSMKDKLSQGGANSDMPLLLRLLIAVFPFLGSWTKML
uniref:Uncharacterized protein LOC8265692 n=2 Tax=Rhizophora mucronata TaxID=61149 RepID=A0A2P2J8J5_RHIMU